MNKPMLISVYDASGEWAKPYIEAGWKVLLWDKQYEGNILERLGGLKYDIETELQGERLFGILAAPPCTDFAGSGARWWEEKDKGERWWPEVEDGDWETIYFDNPTELSVTLVEVVRALVSWFDPIFWAIEQPVGRIESLLPWMKEHRQMTFDPCDYGDPYTKKTVLYGEFNTNLPKNKVEPTEGSKMHQVAPGKERKNIRSKTPSGFARAFYEANNEHSEYRKQKKLFEKTA